MVLKNFFQITPDKRRVKINKKQGVVYNNPRWWKKIIFYFGSVLVLFSLVLVLYIYEPIMIAWFKYKLIDQSSLANRIEEIKKENITPTVRPTLAPIAENTQSINESDEFNILIPKIGADAEIQAGVAANNKTEYMTVLKKDMVAQALGTALPGGGNGKMIFLFAHSSEQGVFDARENPVFYLLDKLENNDDIFINYRGKLFTYKVYTKKIIGAKETQYLNYSENDKEVLILQTCWPIGTNWQRLLVFAEKI